MRFFRPAWALAALAMLSACTTPYASMDKGQRAVAFRQQCSAVGHTGQSLGICTSDMERQFSEQRGREVAAIVAVALVGTVVAICASKHNCGGGGGGSSEQYAWDEFSKPNAYGNYWACRSTSSGRFVENGYCSSKEMNDYTWPGLSA